mmetsp:Transcript_4966/g.19868  ORF Transcript_4966/g.19868 Transcript_4966/m.19868 type:complete len:366 (-) Transcript_4966:147-1244(-)
MVTRNCTRPVRVVHTDLEAQMSGGTCFGPRWTARARCQRCSIAIRAQGCRSLTPCLRLSHRSRVRYLQTILASSSLSSSCPGVACSSSSTAVATSHTSTTSHGSTAEAAAVATAHSIASPVAIAAVPPARVRAVVAPPAHQVPGEASQRKPRPEVAEPAPCGARGAARARSAARIGASATTSAAPAACTTTTSSAAAPASSARASRAVGTTSVPGKEPLVRPEHHEADHHPLEDCPLLAKPVVAAIRVRPIRVVASVGIAIGARAVVALGALQGVHELAGALQNVRVHGAGISLANHFVRAEAHAAGQVRLALPVDVSEAISAAVHALHSIHLSQVAAGFALELRHRGKPPPRRHPPIEEREGLH